MKTTVLMLALLLSIGGVAQVLHTKDQKFVRIFDIDGNKVLKGRLYRVSDSTLTIRFRDNLHNIAAADIGAVKFKRSIGSNAITGALIGGGIGAIFGGTIADQDKAVESVTGLKTSTGDGIAAGFIMGLPIGAAMGGMTGFLRKKKVISINGDLNTWATFKNDLLSGGE